jgi:serine/threonine protein kinase
MDQGPDPTQIAQRIGDGEALEEPASGAQADDSLLPRLFQLARIAGSYRRAQSLRDDESESSGLPQAIGNYRIQSLLGRGSVGVVYAAEQRDSGRPVALKVIRQNRSSDPRALAWFRREARTLALLQHPGIAEIYEFGEAEPKLHYIAMELVQGQTLDAWVRARAQTASHSQDELRLRLALFVQICRALAHAHSRGIVHRDLKPANIMVCPHPEPAAKVLDFGLAHAAFSTVLTDAGRLQGTVAYMSPEQIEGDPAKIDARSDIYALGVIGYELLCGELPYELSRGSLAERIRHIREQPPIPLAARWGGQPALAVERMLMRALEKDPRRRYRDLAEWIGELEAYLGDRRPRPWRLARRILGRKVEST